MAAYVNLPDPRELDALESTAASAATVAEREHARIADAARKLADPRSKEARNLTAKEAFDERQRLRAEGTATIQQATGDLAAHRAALARIAEGLDLRGIAARAEFLPIMGSGAESTAHDLRILARSALRAEYRDRLPRMKPNDHAVEARRIMRDAGDRPDWTPELAKLHELDAHVRGLPTGPETTAAKSAVIAAWSGIESQWAGRADLLDRAQRVAWRLDHADDISRAIREGREPSAATRAHAIARELVAAGRR